MVCQCMGLAIAKFLHYFCLDYFSLSCIVKYINYRILEPFYKNGLVQNFDVFSCENCMASSKLICSSCDSERTLINGIVFDFMSAAIVSYY